MLILSSPPFPVFLKCSTKNCLSKNSFRNPNSFLFPLFPFKILVTVNLDWWGTTERKRLKLCKIWFSLKRRNQQFWVLKWNLLSAVCCASVFLRSFYSVLPSACESEHSCFQMRKLWTAFPGVSDNHYSEYLLNICFMLASINLESTWSPQIHIKSL